MSITAQEIADFVWEIAPNPAYGTENIWEIGDGTPLATGIGVAWWLTSEMLTDMAERGLNVGLSHERVIYDLPEQYMWGEIIDTWQLPANNRIVGLAKERGIAIHRFHSNLDAADWGMPRALFAQLGWSDRPTDWSRGVPVVEIEPIDLKSLIEHIKQRLGLPFVRYDGDLSRIIRRVAVPWGGLCQWWSGAACAVPLGFDAIIGGDIIDGVVRLAREEGWAVIDAMHHATELGAMERLVDKLRARFPDLPVHYYENSMPWAIV